MEEKLNSLLGMGKYELGSVPKIFFELTAGTHVVLKDGRKGVIEAITSSSNYRIKIDDGGDEVIAAPIHIKSKID